MKIPVALATAPYDVYIGHGVRHDLAAVIADVAPKARVAVIITTPSLRAQPWFDLALGIDTHVLEAPEGESAKTLTTVASLCEAMATIGLSRHDLVVGVGGGATTDLAGFAAAVYLRGIAVVHVATSIAGQVDAAIGGKTGANLAAGKNLVGAFHQPRAVFCDLETVETLSDRERRGGLGEVAKCWLLERRSVESIATATLEEQVAIAVQLKATIVAEDEFETTGRRALLNYGHTLGHAVELLALENDRDLLRHGEAVAIGLRFAARLAVTLGLCGEDEVTYTDDVVAAFGLTGTLPYAMGIDELLAIMARDKKAHHNLTFVLATNDGIRVVPDVSAEAVRATYASCEGVLYVS